VQINGPAVPPPVDPGPPKSRNGGGSFGWLGAMLLVLAGALRRRFLPRLQAARSRA
jgi:MYXO-CTERM domain-containing protein